MVTRGHCFIYDIYIEYRTCQLQRCVQAHRLICVYTVCLQMAKPKLRCSAKPAMSLLLTATISWICAFIVSKHFDFRALTLDWILKHDFLRWWFRLLFFASLCKFFAIPNWIWGHRNNSVGSETSFAVAWRIDDLIHSFSQLIPYFFLAIFKNASKIEFSIDLNGNSFKWNFEVFYPNMEKKTNSFAVNSILGEFFQTWRKSGKFNYIHIEFSISSTYLIVFFPIVSGGFEIWFRILPFLKFENLDFYRSNVVFAK